MPEGPLVRCRPRWRSVEPRSGTSGKSLVEAMSHEPFLCTRMSAPVSVALDVLEDPISEDDAMLCRPLEAHVSVHSSGEVDGDIGEGLLGLHSRSQHRPLPVEGALADHAVQRIGHRRLLRDSLVEADALSCESVLGRAIGGEIFCTASASLSEPSMASSNATLVATLYTTSL